MGKVKAVIFDVDGLMFDTEKVGKMFFKKLNKKYNIKLTEKFRQNLCGKKESAIREEIKKVLPNVDVDKYRDEHSNSGKENLLKNGWKQERGLKNILNFLKSKAIKIGIASGSPMFHIDNIIKKANIDINIFDAIVCADDNVESKPSPVIIEKVCEKLNVNPKNALVLEDAINGIMSATSAGSLAIMVPDLIKPNDVAKKLCYKIVSNLNSAQKEISRLI